MTTANIARSRRRGKLNTDERRLLAEIGESFKASGPWPESPEYVPMDIAVRAAERAYRRGVTHGAYFMLWHLRGDAGYHPGQPGDEFAAKLSDWRMRGSREEYAKAEYPPGPAGRTRGDAPR